MPHPVPIRMNKSTTVSHIDMKLQKSNDKKKILNSYREGERLSTEDWELDYYLSFQHQHWTWEDAGEPYSKF